MPITVSPFFFSRGLCYYLLLPRLDFSPTAPAAPSLRQLIPSGSLVKFQLVQCIICSYFYSRVAGAPIIPPLTLSVASSFSWAVAEPSRVFSHPFTSSPDYSILIHQPNGLPEAPVGCLLHPLASAVLRPGPLFHFSTPGASVFSSPISFH